MIWKVKDINKEQMITVLVHLPHLIHMSHSWHILPRNQVELIPNEKFKFPNITTEEFLF